jgi:hypothetical protein
MEDDVVEAELLRDNNQNRYLTGIASATIAVSIAFLMVSVVFTDVADKSLSTDSVDYGIRVPVWERGDLDYITWICNGIWGL